MGGLFSNGHLSPSLAENLADLRDFHVGVFGFNLLIVSMRDVLGFPCHGGGRDKRKNAAVKWCLHVIDGSHRINSNTTGRQQGRVLDRQFHIFATTGAVVV